MKMHGTEFDRGDIILHIHESTQIGEDEYRIDFGDVDDVVRALPGTIADALCEFGGRVEIKDFGTFTIELRAPDSGVDPNGNPWTTPERYKVKFKAAPAFVQIIEERTGIPAF